MRQKRIRYGKVCPHCGAPFDVEESIKNEKLKELEEKTAKANKSSLIWVAIFLIVIFLLAYFTDVRIPLMIGW